jgi:hypothetical protein
MKHKLIQVVYEREGTTKQSGRIEVDEAYHRGENLGGKAGRGSEYKVPFIAAIQTNFENHPLYAVFSEVKAFGNDEVAEWATRSLVPTSTVVSDGLC